MNIYVGNLPHATTDTELKQAFEEFGSVSSAVIIMDKATGRSRGFGFVEMPNQAEAEEAIAQLNDQEFGGRPLTVNEARPRDDRPKGRGSRGGQREGGFREGGYREAGADDREGGYREGGHRKGGSRGGNRGGGGGGSYGKKRDSGNGNRRSF